MDITGVRRSAQPIHDSFRAAAVFTFSVVGEGNQSCVHGLSSSTGSKQNITMFIRRVHVYGFVGEKGRTERQRPTARLFFSYDAVMM